MGLCDTLELDQWNTSSLACINRYRKLGFGNEKRVRSPVAHFQKQFKIMVAPLILYKNACIWGRLGHGTE